MWAGDMCACKNKTYVNMSKERGSARRNLERCTSKSELYRPIFGSVCLTKVAS